MMRTSVLAVLLLTITQFAAAADNWPQFRGPGMRGVADNSNLPDQWSATENVVWKYDDPGRGWSSPVVWGDRVYLTTVVTEGETKEARKGLYFGGEQSKPVDAVHHWKVVCLDVAAGNVVWDRKVHEGKPETALHIKNTYASETPVVDGERIYAYFGNLGIFCLNMEGDPVWDKRFEPHKTRFGWGTAASPVLHKDRLYIVNDNEEESWLAAFDKRTGKELWRTARDEKSNWATPYLWENDVRTEIVTPGTGKTRGYDLDGELLWELRGASSITIATPYTVHGLLYVSSGYILDPRRPVYAIRPGATGDISLDGDSTSNDSIAWCQKQAAPYNPTTLVYGDLLYVLLDRGFLACYEAKTGKLVYDRKRLPNGRAITASPWAYDGKIFCLNEDGVTFVVKAGREFELIRTCELADDDMGMASPAVAGDKLLIRTSERIYCIGKPGD